MIFKCVVTVACVHVPEIETNSIPTSMQANDLDFSILYADVR